MFAKRLHEKKSCKRVEGRNFDGRVDLGRKNRRKKKEEIEKERRGRERGNPFKSGSKSG